ncbi:MAG: hypothetical protein ACR2M1_14400, partial [Gemmatimonadaceae bacterium]
HLVTWTVRFTASAEDDVAAACAWYATSREGLGEEFIGDIDAVVRTIAEFPETEPLIHRELRLRSLSDLATGRKELLICGAYYRTKKPTCTRALQAHGIAVLSVVLTFRGALLLRR